MNNNLIFLGMCLFICACSTSKFDYQRAYKFSQYNYQHQPQTALQIPTQGQGEQLKPLLRKTPEVQARPSSPPLASLKPVPAVSDLHSAQLSAKLNQIKEKAEAYAKRYETASNAEKKVIRQEVKQEYKTLRQEVKKAKKEAANNVQFNSKMYIGLVVFAAGLLIAILASGPIGAVAIIVGIALIAWGFIEQA